MQNILVDLITAARDACIVLGCIFAVATVAVAGIHTMFTR